MRIGLPFALAIALGAATCAKSEEARELDALSRCVSEVRAEVGWCRRVIPAEIFSMDRRLHQMAFGLEPLEDNHELLRRRFSEGRMDPEDRHLLANAVEGCRSFQANFKSRLRLFLALTACLVSLGTALTVRALYSIVPPPNESAGGKPQGSPPSRAASSGAVLADKPRQDRRS